ncbi:YqfQ family protein [Fictibacillus nanhaiensis]|uniref:YqfQ family protein n=1 Tax=Fictibacillus nanhaiensis TaxID=742169 RepID=UPI001C96F51F|nr:YqfQ family protein [Fictibacillus nanhaiensis]MBY6035461.1 YqfQ family protein [Fictibacillus nanhaiensis]
MQPFYRYPTQPQHPMQPFQINPHMQNMHGMSGMNGMPRNPGGSVDRFLGTIGSGGSVTGGTNVFTMLNNVQKVLKVAETMGPMIKQYGPAMKNLPSIMTALKDFQSGSSTKTEADGKADTSEKADKVEKKNEPKGHNAKKKENADKIKSEKEKKEEKTVQPGAKSTKTSNIQPIQKSKKAPSATKPVPTRPRANVPKGYHLSGPKLYV